MLNNHCAKSDFRKSCINRLKFNSRFIKIQQDKNIVKNILKIIDKLEAKNILLYIPMKMEVDVRPLINILRKRRGVRVFVPYMQGESFKAVKYRLPLDLKRFGIQEPRNSFLKSKKIDLAVVPVVGIDADCKRIGFGKGMYDRYFYALDYEPTIVFTQKILCKTDKRLSNQYDIQADYIVTN
jgi:5-formyltetrahydrofolate cyclo-ligase